MTFFKNLNYITRIYYHKQQKALADIYQNKEIKRNKHINK